MQPVYDALHGAFNKKVKPEMLVAFLGGGIT